MTLLFRLLTVAWLCCAAMAATNVVPSTRSVSMGTNGLSVTTIPYALTSTLITNSPLAYTNSAIWLRDAGIRLESSNNTKTNRISWGQENVDYSWIERWNLTGDMIFGVQLYERMRIAADGRLFVDNSFTIRDFTIDQFGNTFVIYPSADNSFAFGMDESLQYAYINSYSWMSNSSSLGTFTVYYTTNMGGILPVTVAGIRFGGLGTGLAGIQGHGFFGGVGGIAINPYGANVMVGTNVYPTARLHLAPGATNASSAPLKIGEGPLLLTAEEGAIEYSTNELYATLGSTRRFVINTASQVVGAGTDYSLTTTITNIAFGTTDPNITLPLPGTYSLAYVVRWDTGATATDTFRFALYNKTTEAFVAGSWIGVDSLVASEDQQVSMPGIVVTTTSADNVIHLQGVNDGSAAGTVVSTNTYVSFLRIN